MKTRSFFLTMLSAGLAIFMTAFTYTANAQNETLDYSTSVEDLKTAKATVQAYEDQDWDELRTYLKDDARIYGLASFDTLDVDQTIRYWKKGTDKAIPDLAEETWLAVAIPEGIRQGNWVYHWGVNTLSYATGEKIIFPYHIALKIDQNKVEEAHFYYDNMKIIREMGYAISPPLEDGEPVEEVLDLNFEKSTEKN